MAVKLFSNASSEGIAQQSELLLAKRCIGGTCTCPNQSRCLGTSWQVHCEANQSQQLTEPRLLNLIANHDQANCVFQKCCQSCLVCALGPFSDAFWAAGTTPVPKTVVNAFHKEVSRLAQMGVPPCGNAAHRIPISGFDCTAGQDDPGDYIGWMMEEIQSKLQYDGFTPGQQE
jgi:hypothetical protein